MTNIQPKPDIDSVLQALRADKAESPSVVRVPWDEFASKFAWKQGEHVGLIGPTGSGKTNLAFWLLPMRKYVVIFGTKPRDKSLDQFGKSHGYKKLKQWDKLSERRFPRRIIWPNARNLESQSVQIEVFTDSMRKIYLEGGWSLYIDELWFLGHVLGLTKLVKIYLQQARSMNISLVISSQRPAWIPVEVFDQSTHLFFARDNDHNNLKRISAIGYIDANLIRDTVARLKQYEFLYVNTRNGDMAVIKPPPPKETK